MSSYSYVEGTIADACKILEHNPTVISDLSARVGINESLLAHNYDDVDMMVEGIVISTEF
jgi:hypothetical protein